jgi:hypothetical protein
VPFHTFGSEAKRAAGVGFSHPPNHFHSPLWSIVKFGLKVNLSKNLGKNGSPSIADGRQYTHFTLICQNLQG